MSMLSVLTHRRTRSGVAHQSGRRGALVHGDERLVVFVDRILPRALARHKLIEGIACVDRVESTPFENHLAMGDFPEPIAPFEPVHVAPTKG